MNDLAKNLLLWGVIFVLLMLAFESFSNRGGAQPLRFEAKPPRKEKPIDPDSPFAKLAALKEQMKK